MLDQLAQPQTPYESTPFPKLNHEQFADAFGQAMETARKRVKTIENLSHPDFENTIEALELASLELDQVSSLFFNLYHACTSDSIDAQVGPISEKLAQFSNDIQLSTPLFQKIQSVYEKKEDLKLNQEQSRLLQDTYESFVRNGALLNEEQKQELREMDQQLATLSPKFSQNLLKATNQFRLNLTEESQLEGLPASVIEAAKAEAKNKSEDGWTFTLQAPSYIPFMKFMSVRSLREQMWRAYSSKALTGEHSNRDICGQIAKLRHKRARLLGFTNHADFVLKKRMAKSLERVESFLEELRAPSLNAAKEDIKQLHSFVEQHEGKPLELMPWDFAYYSEKLKKHLFDLSEEDLRPYFPLPHVVEGLFAHAHKLYNMEFKLNSDIPVYHPEVKAYEVWRDQDFVGLFYMDLYPRENKKSGAWMTNYQDQGFDGKSVRRPHVSIACNFSRPGDDTPSLLTFNEVQTLFHEFGHALHSLSSQCHYRSLGGTHVLWDFVELPSQLMENWTYEPESLEMISRHYKTGESLPQDLVEKVQRARRFQAGYASLRQVSFSLVDLSWHGDIDQTDLDPVELEKKAIGDLRLLPDVEGTNFSVGFGHIFAGGYSAGYYSYKWAEVLDADAFEAFKEAGIFNQEVAQRFYKEVLSRGGTEDPEVLYKNFRGREPSPQALFTRSGLS